MTQDNWQPGTPPGGRRRTQHPTAENPFEEPEQSPELRQERSPDLYRATNPFWNQPFRDAESASAPPDLGEPPQSPPPEASVWSHPPVLDTDSYSEETQKRHHRTRRVWKAIVPLALAILFVAFLFGGVLTVRNIRVTGNVRISAEEIIRLSKLKLGQSSLINEKEISNRIEQNPYLICRMVSLESFDTICFFIGMNILLSPVLNLTWLLVLNMLLWALIHLIINRCIILYKEKSSINEIN